MKLNKKGKDFFIRSILSFRGMLLREFLKALLIDTDEKYHNKIKFIIASHAISINIKDSD